MLRFVFFVTKLLLTRRLIGIIRVYKRKGRGYMLFRRYDINKGIEEWKKVKGAVLLDVRTNEEYSQRHIEGSVNLPLDRLEEIEDLLPQKDTAIFVHCKSGVRSAHAERLLKEIGYSDVSNIGGIDSYKGVTV